MRIKILNATGDVVSQETVDTRHKKIFLKENCGDSAAPSVQDIATMTPQAAYDAGYNDAIKEVMEMITGMIGGAVPVDMAIPADLINLDQLEEGD